MKHGLAVEVGCQLGRSSSVLAQLSRAIGFRTVHIDPYTDQTEWLQAWVKMMYELAGTFCLLCMRTEQARPYLAEFSLVDLAFIDGDHQQHAVEVDLHLVAEAVRKGGLLVAHDYASESEGPGVRAAIDPFVAEGWEYLGTTVTMGVWRRK